MPVAQISMHSSINLRRGGIPQYLLLLCISSAIIKIIAILFAYLKNYLYLCSDL